MELVNKAVVFAAQAHDGMRRKDGATPYILHPLEAAAAVGAMTEDQEVLAAALLHDVIEDAGITPEEIEKEFGLRVKNLVLAETETAYPAHLLEETWQSRKAEAVERLRSAADPGVKMMYLGDKLSNLKAIERELDLLGEALWQRFHETDPAMHRWYYRSIAEATRELQDTQVWKEYDRLIIKVFGEEKGRTE